jgi:preprotein translocase subunit SecG
MDNFWKHVTAVSLGIVFIYVCITMVNMWAEKKRHEQFEKDIRAIQVEIIRNIDQRSKK